MGQARHSQMEVQTWLHLRLPHQKDLLQALAWTQQGFLGKESVSINEGSIRQEVSV